MSAINDSSRLPGDGGGSRKSKSASGKGDVNRDEQEGVDQLSGKRMLQAAGDSHVGVGVGVGVDVDDFIQSLPEIIGTANPKLFNWPPILLESPTSTIVEPNIIPTTDCCEELKFLVISTVDQKNIGTSSVLVESLYWQNLFP
ncbi:hypothetical protein WN51_14691 [Melipona quadrifasciata]|uniref:Uncharacterized protein n=1 Tax=Melipona quadrifasciata TaxID=166423 RepID=A0A0M9A2T1_9HYME|nr:hypothetical protein WN51_14691 [Melipona quadrifasciata]